MVAERTSGGGICDRRAGERRLDFDLAPADDARLRFIGRIRTPWNSREQCPKNTRDSHALCTIEVAKTFHPALMGLETASHVIVLYWLDRAERDLLVQYPRHAPRPLGTFALRSPNRPNPLGVAAVPLIAVTDGVLTVTGLDCLDETPLLDLKPYLATTDSHCEATLGWRAEP